MSRAGAKSIDSEPQQLAPDGVVSRFENIALRHADEIAIVSPAAESALSANSVTYKDLNVRRLEIAGALATDHGVGAGDRVGLFQSRDADTLAAMLGIATAGASYVPLDTEIPASRLDFIRQDAGVKVSLTTDELDKTSAVSISSLLGTQQSFDTVHGDAPLYIMYTSGSTGQPKGVIVPHKAVCRLVIDTDFMTLDSSTRFLHLAPQSFDAATLEIWGPLLNGGVCVLYPNEVVDPRFPT